MWGERVRWNRKNRQNTGKRLSLVYLTISRCEKNPAAQKKCWHGANRPHHVAPGMGKRRFCEQPYRIYVSGIKRYVYQRYTFLDLIKTYIFLFDFFQNRKWGWRKFRPWRKNYLTLELALEFKKHILEKSREKTFRKSDYINRKRVKESPVVKSGCTFLVIRCIFSLLITKTPPPPAHILTYSPVVTVFETCVYKTNQMIS